MPLPKPIPPDILIDALQDPVHKDVGRSRGDIDKQTVQQQIEETTAILLSRVAEGMGDGIDLEKLTMDWGKREESDR